MRGMYVRYYVQQLFCLFQRCCIVGEKCKHLTLWSRDFFSLSFQACPLHISVPWWESVIWQFSSRHVCAVKILHSSIGVTSNDFSDHLQHRDWAYLCNCTLSQGWCRRIRFWNCRPGNKGGWGQSVVFIDEVLVRQYCKQLKQNKKANHFHR